MATSTIPTPRSYQQILGEQLNAVRSKLGIRKFKPGGPLLSIHEASSQSDARNSADIFIALQTRDLDNAEGQALDRIGNDEECPRRQKKASTGNITIFDSAFTKKSSVVYHGKSAPIVGSVTLYVTKGDTFDTAPSSGQVYIGRGTSNYEGPITYSAKTNAGFYWEITTTATTKFHNRGESVILAQGGNRPISVGQTVSTTQGASTAPVLFKTTQYASIPDGETEVELIPIVCTVDGIFGNVPAESIVSFGGSAPFSTATVTNPKKINLGRDVELDGDYRDRIRQTRANKQRGTDVAIKNSVIDLTSPDESSSILSASIVRRKNRPTILYIDDGSGYEEKSTGIGYEVVVDSAAGGETDFLTNYSPIAQAYVEAANQAPYTIIDGSSLTVRVGGISSTHFFDSLTLNSFLSASAFDVISSINNNQELLFQARATQNSTSFAIFSKSEINDDIEVVPNSDTSLDAAIVFGLNTAVSSTTSVYKNDILLSKDGKFAQISSTPYSSWAPLFVSETIIINTDNTGAITCTITDTDFQSLGYTLLSNATPEIWASVLSHKLPGITASTENDRVILTSNKGKNSNASIEIVGGTLTTKGVFALTSNQGISTDYEIDRSVGTIVLNQALSTGDKLTLGTEWAEAFVETDFGTSTLALTADSNYYVSLDDIEATIIPTPIFRVGTYSSVAFAETPTTNVFRIEDSTPSVVSLMEMKRGDWVLFNDPAFDPDWKKIFRTGEDGFVSVVQGADQATRIGHTVTALSGGNMIVMGGATSIQTGIGLPGALKGRCVTGNCQLYDQSNGSWTQLPDMITPRVYHTATLLQNGDIFIAGGFDTAGNPLSSTEIFDTSEQTFSAGNSLPTSGTDPTLLPRVHHTATLLSSGKVLVAGGCSTTEIGDDALVSTIIYNPTSTLYETCGDMSVARYGHQAVLDVDSGYVFVFGGISLIDSPATPIVSVESFDDSFFAWTNRTAMTSARAFFGACQLRGTPSKIIVAGNGARFNSDNNKTTTTASGTSDVYSFVAEPTPWVGEVSLIAGYPGEFIQSDLVASYTTGNVIAGYVLSSADPISLNVSTVTYNVGTGLWDVFSESSDLHMMSYIDNREAVVGAAIVSGGPKGDTVCWFGGATCVDTLTQSFVGFTNVDQVDTYGLTRSHPFPTFVDLALTEGRIISVRGEYAPVLLTIPSNSGYLYTADSFAPVINLLDKNVLASVFDTTKVRLSTLSSEGAVLVVDKDEELAELSPTETTISQQSQYAHAISRSELDLPLGFQLRTVGASKTNELGPPQTITVPDYVAKVAAQYLPEPMPANGTVVGVELYQPGSTKTSYSLIGDHCDHFGNSKGGSSIIGGISSGGIIEESTTETFPSTGYDVSIRSAFPITVGNPIYVAAPYKFAVTDTLNVTIDRDTTTKRFVIPMARKMATNGNYQTPLSLKDADNSNKTISSGFGVDYNFDDFAIISRARIVTHSTVSSKKVIWRYYRYGEEGNNVSIRYTYPTEPSQPISISTNVIQETDSFSYYDGKPKATVDICLGSGALRQNRNTTSNTRFGVTKGGTISTPKDVWLTYLFVGFSVTSGYRGSTNGDTTLEISVPYAPSIMVSPGLVVGDVLWYEGASPSSSTLQNGAFTIKTINNPVPGVWRITINALELNDGTIWAPESNPGTVSTDPKQEARFDSEVVVGDLVVFNGLASVISPNTMRVLGIDTNRQYLECTAVDFDPTPYTTAQYSVLSAATDLKIFAPPTDTTQDIVNAVNIIPNCPVSGTVTGSGTGIVSVSTWDEFSDAAYRYDLVDGINYVQNTNNPANITLPTTFDLKHPVSSSLASSNDFENEIFYLVPQLTKSVVQWLNTPTITGLWSVATVTTSGNGSKIQIKSNTPGNTGSVFIEGGAANANTAAVIGMATSSEFNSALTSGLVLTTTKSESEGLCGNSWVELNNTTALTKVTDSDSIWGSSNSILSIEDGVVTFSSAPYTKEELNGWHSHVVGFVEKIGKYAAIRLSKALNPAMMILAKAGNWIHIKSTTAPTYPTNYGTFRVLRFTQTESEWVYWVDNPNAVTADEFGLTTTIYNLSENSLIPGDSLSINVDTLGVINRGTWTIVDVGNGYTDNTVTVDISNKQTSLYTGSLACYINNVSVVEKSPTKAIKKLLCISPNTNNSNNVDLLFDDNSSLFAWQQGAGTVLSAQEKLGFPNSIKTGVAAYLYNTGLIAETKRVIYGDSGDQDNYSGYVAEGAQVLIQGPVIKQIKLTLQVRLQINSTGTDVSKNVKSAVAGLINANPIGTPIAISDIISVAQGVNGVIAVSVVSPNYNSVQDRIDVKNQEKAIVVDFENDIKVLVVGD